MPSNNDTPEGVPTILKVVDLKPKGPDMHQLVKAATFFNSVLAGSVDGFMIASLNKDGSATTVITNVSDQWKLMVAIYRLLHNVQKGIDQQCT